jgi:hypothetical protein
VEKAGYGPNHHLALSQRYACHGAQAPFEITGNIHIPAKQDVPPDEAHAFHKKPDGNGKQQGKQELRNPLRHRAKVSTPAKAINPVCSSRPGWCVRLFHGKWCQDDAEPFVIGTSTTSSAVFSTGMNAPSTRLTATCLAVGVQQTVYV